jgi:hypothetical protein
MSKKTLVIGPNGEVHLVDGTDRMAAADKLRQRGNDIAAVFDFEQCVRQATNGRHHRRRQRW